MITTAIPVSTYIFGSLALICAIALIGYIIAIHRENEILKEYVLSSLRLKDALMDGNESRDKLIDLLMEQNKILKNKANKEKE